MEISDYDLIQNCLNGKKDDFAVLITRYKKLVYNVIYNSTGSLSHADDLSQEVFLKAYKSMGSFDPEYKFATWIIKITTNACIDFFRKNKFETETDDFLKEAEDNRFTPEEEFIKNEELVRIRNIISGLPEKYRLPVVLFHEHGMSYRELEQILNEPETIIKNRLYRARIMLREKLNSEMECIKK